MGLFKSEKPPREKPLITDYFTLYGDAGRLTSSTEICAHIYNDRLEFMAMGFKTSFTPVTVSLSQITDAYWTTETALVEKNKSSIGRAVAGGILFGGVGAIVGAASGTGKKEKKVQKRLIVISYTGKNGDDGSIVFEDVKSANSRKFLAKLKEVCNIQEHETSAVEL
jgi:hypothetical protein